MDITHILLILQWLEITRFQVHIHFMLLINAKYALKSSLSSIDHLNKFKINAWISLQCINCESPIYWYLHVDALGIPFPCPPLLKNHKMLVVLCSFKMLKNLELFYSIIAFFNTSHYFSHFILMRYYGINYIHHNCHTCISGA